MTRRPNIRCLIVIALVLSGSAFAAVQTATAGAAPGATANAKIRLSHACYQTAQRATLHGSGFAPSARWRASLDGSAFGSGKTNATGGIVATFGVPSHLHPGSTGEDSYKLVVREGKHSASTKFLVTHLDASFTPASSQDLSTLKVTFHLLGWGHGGSLYLHYVNPKGVSRFDRDLGTPGGACGHLTTAQEKLFPFTPKVGKWTLQFDKSAVYKATSVPRVVVPYKVS